MILSDQTIFVNRINLNTFGNVNGFLTLSWLDLRSKQSVFGHFKFVKSFCGSPTIISQKDVKWYFGSHEWLSLAILLKIVGEYFSREEADRWNETVQFTRGRANIKLAARVLTRFNWTKDHSYK